MAAKKNNTAPKAGPRKITDDPHGVADPAPASGLEDASGAIIEPAIIDAVDVAHESVDGNPRAGTTTTQNSIDWNDPKRMRPDEPDFTGQGVDRAVYGKAAE